MFKSIFRILTVVLFCNFLFSCSGDDESGPKPYYGSVRFETQKEVDSFAALNYTAIYGGLSLYNAEIRNLDALENLTRINGNILIEGTSLKDVNGLENLTEFSFNSDIILWSNPELENLDGFKNLPATMGGIIIFENSKLEDIDGLSNIKFVEGKISIADNGNLTNLDGISNVEQIKEGEKILIWNNASLTNLCGLENIAELGVIDLDIKDNAFNPSRQELTDGNCSM